MTGGTGRARTIVRAAPRCSQLRRTYTASVEFLQEGEALYRTRSSSFQSPFPELRRGMANACRIHDDMTEGGQVYVSYVRVGSF